MHDNTIARIDMASRFMLYHMFTKERINMFFKQTEEADLFNRMCAISSILTAKKIVSNRFFSKRIQPHIEKIHNSSAERDGCRYVTTPMGSPTVCNALMTIIADKYPPLRSYVPAYASGMIDHIDSFISKYSITSVKDSTQHPGLVVIALLTAFERTGIYQFMSAASDAIQCVIKSTQFSVYDAWAIALCGQYDKKYFSEHMHKLVATMDIRLEAMSGVVVPLSLQTLMAAKFMNLEVKNLDSRIDNLTELMNSHQVTDTNMLSLDADYMGSFIKEPSDTTVRLDYVFHGLFAMSQSKMLKDSIKDLHMIC